VKNPIARLGSNLQVVLRGVPPDSAHGPDDPRIQRAARGVVELYGLMAVAVGLWVVYLAIALPERSTAQHYDVTWVGFDLFLIAAMAATAYWAWRLDPRVGHAANATATLLIVDAWMDITTSPTATDFRVAIAMAAFLELPLAYLSLRVAHNVHRSIAAQAQRASAEAAAAETAAAATTV